MSQTALAMAALEPYIPSAQKPWNQQRVQHLYRRIGFGATQAQTQAALAVSPDVLIEQLLNTAAGLPLPALTVWSNYTQADYDAQTDTNLKYRHREELFRRWTSEMVNEGIRAKMSFFWHNHFVTSLDVYDSNSYLWAYYSLLNEYAFGNFKTFATKMGKTGAMLVYLNGNSNVKTAPNENYARELMELFTMGEGNGYTQNDVIQMAKALTGWRAKDYEGTPPYFDATKYDTGNKTIFGQTGAWNYDDAHNLIFTLRKDQVANRICTKLYRFFVCDKVDTDVIAEMMTTFKANNFEILPVLKQLFKSEHFFESYFFNSHIKSAYETFIPLLKCAGLTYPTDITDNLLGTIFYWTESIGQTMFYPPNVAGWIGHHNWLNENTITYRWSYMNAILYGVLTDANKAKLRDLAIALTNHSGDAVFVTQSVAEFFLNTTLRPEHLAVAVQYFKDGIPEHYFMEGSWSLDWDEAPKQVTNLLSYLVRLPEYQVM